jgi:hypothetical protein
VLDRTLASQTDDVPANQFAKWTVNEVTAQLAGAVSVSLLPAGTSTCDVVQRGAAVGSTCGITGIVLEPGSTGTVTVRLGITALEVIRARRDELTAIGDVDGDGDLDFDDNCPYVFNPDQENANAEDEGDDPVGDACSINDAANDTDDDGVADASDNCVYIHNEGQENATRDDGFADGVGDACQQRVLVTLPGGGLVIERTADFTISDQRVTILQIDFKTKDSLVNCDVDFTSCEIDDTVVALTVL